VVNVVHWIVQKNGKYVSSIGENGYPLHTKNKEKACIFHDFNVVMGFVNLGYCAIKEY
jgi:hypothetical protein